VWWNREKRCPATFPLTLYYSRNMDMSCACPVSFSCLCFVLGYLRSLSTVLPISLNDTAAWIDNKVRDASERMKWIYVTEISFYERYEVFTAAKIHVEVFWVVTPCSVVVAYKHFRGPAASIFTLGLWNCGILPQHYTASQPLGWSFYAFWCPVIVQLGLNDHY
jgi:hypothetical protein